MKFKEPTKGKGLRKVFKRAGYNVLLVNEYNTSKKSFIDGCETEKFKEQKDPRPWKNGELRQKHGLLRTKCVNENKSNVVITNRDFNGSMNIRTRSYNTINGIDIPEWLKRSKSTSSCSSSVQQ